MMMETIIENNWGGDMNTSLSQAAPPPPIPEVFRTPPYAGKDITSYNTLTFPPTIMEDLLGGEAGAGVAYFNETVLQPYQAVDGSMGNQTLLNPIMFGNTNYGDESAEYIFDRSDVRAIFLVLYTIVFCSCFFGNLMVILVVTLHWRMRSITNFCLANLAFADLCVGIFCVYQNIVTYLMDSWVFGEFMCKMYHFINSLSTTASVLILVVICIERYLAIIHPMTCKQMLTLNRLRITIVFVWILSAAISSPRFYYFSTISMPLPNDQYEILCLPNRTKYNSKLMDMLSMTVLFLIPLTIITILYTHIGIVLWKSSNNRMPAATPTPSVESASSSDSYRETADHNIIQTVNLTLLPLSSPQIVQQQQGRPGTGNCSHCALAATQSGGTQPEKRSSFLPSPFVCLKCRNKSKKQRKQAKKHHCRAVQIPSLEGRVCANCIRSMAVNGNLVSGGVVGGPTGAPGGGVVGQEFIMNCRACQKPYLHQPHTPLPPTMNCELACERSDGSTFAHPCCQHQTHHNHNSNENANGLCAHSGNGNADDQAGRTRDEVTGSPVSTTCCGGRVARPTSICLRRQGLADKATTFSTTPPSPYCTRNCSCLDGKTSKTEPIVLVKFEKKNKKQSSKKGNRKSQCTILMNTKSCHGASQACNGNRSRLCSRGGSSLEDGDTDGDSPVTMSPSPPRFDCTICHPPAMECCGESGNFNVNENHGSGGNGRGILHHHNNHHNQNTCQKNISFEHKRNLSVDSGISATGRNNAEGGMSCEQNLDGACGASCPSCGVSCLESATYQQLYKCHHQHGNHLNVFGPPSPKPPCCNGSHFLASTLASTPTVPKRVRRMRITRSNKYGTSALQSRRRIIRMLIVVVLAFALCHLPFHGRKVWQYWSPKWAQYQAGSVFSTLFTPITFLIMYANSAINPILYAFMSKKFRMSFRDLLCCRMRHSLRISRNASVRSTHAVALSQAGL